MAKGKRGPRPLIQEPETVTCPVHQLERPAETDCELCKSEDEEWEKNNAIEPDDIPHLEEIEARQPGPAGYTCSDCTFRSNLLSEIQEHCNGTQHGGFKSEEPVESAPIQSALFSEPGIVTRAINTPLPEEELNQKRTRLAELYQQVLEVKSAKKAADTDFNAQIADIDEMMQAIARTLRYPTSNQTVRCEWRIIEGENARGLYRLDTGELLEKGALTEEDRAAELEQVEAANEELQREVEAVNG